MLGDGRVPLIDLDGPPVEARMKLPEGGRYPDGRYRSHESRLAATRRSEAEA